MRNLIINIDPVYDVDRVMVQIDDHEEKRVKILSSSFDTVEQALDAASKFIYNE